MKRKFMLMLSLIFALCLITGCGNKKENTETTPSPDPNKQFKNVSDVDIKFSEDYKYFNNTIEELSRVLHNRFLFEGATITDQKNCTGERDDYKYCYKFNLNKYDIVYLLSDKEDMTKRIELHGSVFDTDFAGSMVGIVPSVYVKDLDMTAFKNEIDNTFLASDNLSKTYGVSHVYSHIKFEWSSPDFDYIMSFSADPSQNQEEYALTNDYKESAEREKKYKAEEERKEKEETEKQAKEEAEKLKKKTKTFTAGKYYVGEHIETGRYNMIAVSGRGNCYVSYKVIESFKPGGGSIYIDRYNNVELEEGDTIEVTGSLKIKFEAIK